MSLNALMSWGIHATRFKLPVFVPGRCPKTAAQPPVKPHGGLLGDRHAAAFLLDSRAPKR